MFAGAFHGNTGGINRFNRSHGIAFDTGNLHQTADRVAGQTEVMLHRNFGSVFNLHIGSAHCRNQAGGSH